MHSCQWSTWCLSSTARFLGILSENWKLSKNLSQVYQHDQRSNHTINKNKIIIPLTKTLTHICMSFFTHDIISLRIDLEYVLVWKHNLWTQPYKFIVMCIMMLYLGCSWLSVTRSRLAPNYLCVKTWTATCLSFQLAGINRWRTLPHVAAKKVNNHILQNILNVSFYGLDWINNGTCEFSLSKSNLDEVFHKTDRLDKLWYLHVSPLCLIVILMKYFTK